jgi:magnesium transporter
MPARTAVFGEEPLLINCVVYEKGHRVRDIPVKDISDWRDKPDCFVWVALNEATQEELAELQEEFGLHDLAIEDVLQQDQRPKIEEYDGSLFVVLHAVSCDAGEVQVGEVNVFVGVDFVLSVRSGTPHSLKGVRIRAEQEPDLLRHGPGYVFYALTDAIVDLYFPAVEALEHQLETIEAVMFSTDGARDNIRRLYQLKQQVEKLRHSVVPLNDAIGKLFSGARVPAVVSHSSKYFRDVHDHLQSITVAIDSLRDTIATAIHANLAMVTIEQSEISKRLTAWAAIFAAVTALAGIWGMNFRHMPELDWTFGYPLAVATMVIVAVGLYRRFRRAGWI